MMTEDKVRDQEGIEFQNSDKNSDNLSPLNDKQKIDTNPETGFEYSPINHDNPSKLLLKQMDRFENKGIEKGMFASLDDNVDELKIIYKGTGLLKKDQSLDTIKKRKLFKYTDAITQISTNPEFSKHSSNNPKLAKPEITFILAVNQDVISKNRNKYKSKINNKYTIICKTSSTCTSQANGHHQKKQVRLQKIFS